MHSVLQNDEGEWWIVFSTDENTTFLGKADHEHTLKIASWLNGGGEALADAMQYVEWLKPSRIKPTLSAFDTGEKVS